ncbi:hypothetical protein D3C83_73140 [compost metagenome]
MVGKRLGRQLRQGVLGLGEEIRPAALGSQFLEDKRSHRVLFGLGKLLDLAYGFFEKARHGRSSLSIQILRAGSNAV